MVVDRAPLLAGKTAIITGAARGVGAATARLFAAHGARVVMNDRDALPVEEVANAIRTSGGEALVVAGDITDPAFPDEVLRATTRAFGGCDIVVNNAGYPWDALTENCTDAQWTAMMDVHAGAPFRLVRAALPFFRQAALDEQAANGWAGARKVIFISSIAALHGNAGQAAYASAKAALFGLTKTLAREWGVYNVQVNCACFGFIATRLTHGMENEERISASIPLGRLGKTDEAAGALLFLASPLSNYVSGHVLEVTGGLSSIPQL